MTSQQNTQRVIVGMSGGVDSSVAALLLQRQGYRVEGLFMKNWDEDDGTEYCSAKSDFADARAVAEKIGIPLHTASFAAEYWDNVFEHFLAEYRAGRTPNPDILCNREIKFKAFLNYAKQLGADLIATGHYCKTTEVNGKTSLEKGMDPGKDQSYFLHAVGHTELSQTLFPIGDLHKSEVRRLAAECGLVTHDKKDSTGICFIGERRFRDFLQTYLPAQPGDIVTCSGAVIGRHQGLMYHTIGQRQGLGIGGLSDYAEAPWYVVDKNLADNTLIVAQGAQHPALYKSVVFTAAPFWVGDECPALPLRCLAKIRYRQADQSCTVAATATGLAITFDTPQRAVTPGQSIVFYAGRTCLGGAIIESGA